jgi:hypothetical protein
MNHTEEQSIEMMSELGLNSSLVKFMLSQRNVLNMALLRLKLYEKQNVDEKTVRTGLSSLNNQNVNSLLDLLYKTSNNLKNKIVPKEAPKKLDIVEEIVEVHESDEVEQVGEDEEESHFETFFSQCVRKSSDASDSIKLSEMYNVFTKWWNEHYEDEVPTKDELKDFFSEKLGVKVKSTITHVHLI